jgi:hypothetical protein
MKIGEQLRTQAEMAAKRDSLDIRVDRDGAVRQ